MENPKFKDVLRDLIDEDGGIGAHNLARLSENLQVHEETLTSRRLSGLLSGMQPKPMERRAISLVLEPESKRWLSEIWHLEDVESRRLAKLAFKQMRSHVLAKAFVEYIQEEARFRNEDHSDSELVGLHAEFRKSRELEDEIEIFGL